MEQGGTRPPAQPQALLDFDLVDLTQINGGREQLEGKIPERYGTAEGDVAQGNRANHANYLASWLDVLKEDKGAIFRAAAMHNAPSPSCIACNPVAPKLTRLEPYQVTRSCIYLCFLYYAETGD